MNPPRRKLAFQLTPLLDLLLIVIFAQFMDVQEHSKTQAAQLQSQLAETRDEYEARVDQLQRLRDEALELAHEMERREDRLQAELERLVREQGAIGSAVSEIFGLPVKMLEEAIARRNQSGQPLSEEEEQQLRAEFQRLANQRGREVIRHLMTYQELRKRCDVWEIYVSDSGVVTFTTGTDTFEFRPSSRQDFIDQTLQRFRTVAEPKSLVIIIFSYGDARLGVLEPTLNGMPEVTSQMRKLYKGQTRFEYAVLGFSPQGPTLDGEADQL